MNLKHEGVTSEEDQMFAVTDFPTKLKRRVDWNYESDGNLTLSRAPPSSRL
jgi:hypothetical protein